MPQPLTALMVDSIYSSCIKGSISSKTYRAATSGVEATAAADPQAGQSSLRGEAVAPGRAAAGSASCRSRSGARNPVPACWDQIDASPGQPPRATPRGGQSSGEPLASVLHKSLTGGDAKLPKACVRHTANTPLQGFRRPQPAVFSADLGPKIVGCRRVPARHVNSVGHVSDGHFVRWPVGKKRFKELPADFSMQAANAIHRSAPADRQIGHVETFGRVVRILAAQSQQIVECYAELLRRSCRKGEICWTKSFVSFRSQTRRNFGPAVVHQRHGRRKPRSKKHQIDDASREPARSDRIGSVSRRP